MLLATIFSVDGVTEMARKFVLLLCVEFADHTETSIVCPIMKPDLNHPAIRLGTWLQSMRQAHGFVKRVFAEKIFLSAPRYTEVEAGVVTWIEEKNEKAIIAVLEIGEVALMEFNALIAEARAAVALKFADLFSKEELAPVRYRLSPDRAISEIERELILSAVLATAV